jgi:sugar phosphate isomerase/epimerase
MSRTRPQRPSSYCAKLCLKARPTPPQLADRLRAVDGVWPDGLELYLAAADLASSSVMDEIVARIQGAVVPPGFAYLIEGPVDSLDGADFDVTRDSADDLRILERLAHLAERIGARAVNIHVISPSADASRLTLGCRAALLEKSIPFLRRFVELIESAGAVPTLENMPPVLRMRRGDFSFTPIGMASADLLWCVEQVRGLKILPDTSHAGLYLNARRLAPDPAYAWSAPLMEYLQQLPGEAPDLLGYIQSMAEHVENAQVSNAAGVLGEGLPYGQGDFDLDPVIRWLGLHTRHIVTETIESSNDDAITMRDALRRMRGALA